MMMWMAYIINQNSFMRQTVHVYNIHNNSINQYFTDSDRDIHPLIKNADRDKHILSNKH